MSDPAYPDWMLRDGPPRACRNMRRRTWLATLIFSGCTWAVIARAVMEAW